MVHLDAHVPETKTKIRKTFHAGQIIDDFLVGMKNRQSVMDTPGIEPGTARTAIYMLSGRDNQLHHVP